MPKHDSYLLRISRSRAVNGWQWTARLEHLIGGEHRRFTDPEALLAYLGTVVRADGLSGQPVNEVRTVQPDAAAKDVEPKYGD